MNDNVKKSRAEYQRKYYLEKRKEAFSEERKKRYREDDEYRALVNERSLRYRKKRSAERKKLIAAGKIKRKPRSKPVKKDVYFYIDGEKRFCYSLDEFCNMIGRARLTVYFWIRNGLMPDTPLRWGSNVKCYTDGMIRVVKMVLDRMGRIKKNDLRFYSEVVEGWEDIGVFLDGREYQVERVVNGKE